MALVMERRRSGWDVVLGILLVVGGVVVLGDVALASAVSLYFIAWSALIAGIVLLIVALTKIRTGGAVWPSIGGAVLLVVGIAMLRNPGLALVTLTLMMGAVFLVGGIARVATAFSAPSHRVVHVISGLASLALGLFVFFNPLTASLTLLGIVLGTQILVDGLTLIVAGRMRPAVLV